jgi:purine-binding chemotaxis protein CheW
MDRRKRMSETGPNGLNRMPELISLEIAEQGFCIDINAVREIRGWTEETPMPQASAYLRGVINLRGAVMPVVDLRNRLGLGFTTPSSRHVMVVVQHQDRVAGLLVDAVQETFVVAIDQLQTPPAMDSSSNHLFGDAMIPIDSRLLSRLVVDALLPAEGRLAA